MDAPFLFCSSINLIGDVTLLNMDVSSRQCHESTYIAVILSLESADVSLSVSVALLVIDSCSLCQITIIGHQHFLDFHHHLPGHGLAFRQRGCDPTLDNEKENQRR